MSVHGEVITRKLSPEELAEVIKKYGPPKEPINKYNTRSFIIKDPEKKKQEWNHTPEKKKQRLRKSPNQPRKRNGPSGNRWCDCCGKKIDYRSSTGKCKVCLYSLRLIFCVECLKDGKKVETFRGVHCAKHHSRLKRHGTTELRPKEEKVCEVEECTIKQYSKGWCLMHYKRNRKYGSPYKVQKRLKGSKEFVLVDEREQHDL